jgi:hypothetical protein
MIVDFIMIVGKYFESNNDFINIMMSNKKYKELVLMYNFNPIPVIRLFKSIETKHFYEKQDVKKKKLGMYQYIHWFIDGELMINKQD